jgi:hypothetical protein
MFLSQTTKHKRTHNTIKRVQDDRDPVVGAHGPGGLSGPPEQTGPAPLGRNSVSLEEYGTTLIKLRPARGLDAPSGETLPRSRAGRPLGRDSASLEGQTPPRARLRLARGSRGLATPTTTPPTGAFNVPTHAGAQVKDESAPLLTRLGIISRCCSANPPGEAIPATVRHCAVRPVSAP